MRFCCILLTAVVIYVVVNGDGVRMFVGMFAPILENSMLVY